MTTTAELAPEQEADKMHMPDNIHYDDEYDGREPASEATAEKSEEHFAYEGGGLYDEELDGGEQQLLADKEAIEKFYEAGMGNREAVCFAGDLKLIEEAKDSGDEQFLEHLTERYKADTDWMLQKGYITPEQHLEVKAELKTVIDAGQLNAEEAGTKSQPEGEVTEQVQTANDSKAMNKPEAAPQEEKKISDTINRYQLNIESYVQSRNEAGVAEMLNNVYGAIKSAAQNETELFGLVNQFTEEIGERYSGEDLEWLDDVIKRNPMEKDEAHSDADPEAKPEWQSLGEGDVEDIIEDLVDGNMFNEANAEELSGLVVAFDNAIHEKDRNEANSIMAKIHGLLMELDPEERQGLEEYFTGILDKYLDKGDLDWYAFREGEKNVVPTVGNGPDVDAGRLASALEGAIAEDQAEQAEETEQEAQSKKSIKERIKSRWGALKTAALTMNVKGAFEAVFANEDGEKAKKRFLVTVGVGAAAIAAVVYMNRRGFDVMPAFLDGDGVDLDPFKNNEGDVAGTVTDNQPPAEAPQTVPPVERPPLDENAVGFVDTISSGDGVTHTAQDLARERFGVDLSPSEMSQYWSDMNSQHNPAEISEWFPGSSVGGEWGVSYNSTGQGGMTNKGISVFEDWLRQQGRIS